MFDLEVLKLVARLNGGAEQVEQDHVPWGNRILSYAAWGMPL